MRRLASLSVGWLLSACATTVDLGAPGCTLGAVGPSHVEEGQPVILTFGCDGGGPSDDALDVALPPGAAWDARTWTLTWTPGLDQAGRYDLAATMASGASLTATLWVSDAFDADGNLPPEPRLYAAEDGLPVFHLSFDPGLNSETDTPAALVFDGRTYAIEAQTRGASSLGYPQQSFTLKFAKEGRIDAGALGWTEVDDLILQTGFDDIAGVRSLLGHRLWGTLDEARLTPQSAPVVVYVDGRFHGLYQLLERIDDDFYDARGLDEDGEVFKSTNHDANFYPYNAYGEPKSSWHDGYEKREGLPEDGEPGAYDTLDAVVAWAAEEPTLAEGLADRFDVDELIDWFVFVTYAKVNDSGGKNVHLYRAPAGGPFRITPWDYNASFGQEWETSRSSSDGWYDFADRNRLFVALTIEPALRERMIARYEAHLAGPLAPEALDAAAAILLDETQWSRARSWRRWGPEFEPYFGHGADPSDEDAYLRRWLAERHDAVTAAIAGL